LKQRQVEGKVKSATGFLLKAIKQNYANPEFATEEKKKGMRDEAHTRHSGERKRQFLEEQKSVIETKRDTEMHQLCERIVKENPAILAEAAADIFNTNPLLKKTCEPGKALLDSYHEKLMLRAMMDQYLMEHYPERFRAICDRYEFQLNAFALNTVSEERASA